MIPKLAGLNCPQCGAALQIRSFGNALNVVCPNCLSVLDAKDPNLRLLQEAKAREKVVPLIPLGTRGSVGGVKYEVIGFQVRSASDGDSTYQWQEYLLFNPYRGFRYLTEYHGHWNFVRTVQALPEAAGNTGLRYSGESYTHFSSAQAQTAYVIGEFPWQVRVGDTVEVKDYVHVPGVLSSETTPEETVWSLGEYMEGTEVWKAFVLPGSPPAPFGVFENQPSPFANAGGGLWLLSMKFIVAAAVLAFLVGAVAGNKEVFAQKFSVGAEQSSPAAVVTPAFDVAGHASNLEIQTHNDSDQSLYMRYSLIDQRTGQARTFSREVHRTDHAVVAPVSPGRYSLRIQPDRHPAEFEIRIRRNVPSTAFFWIVAVLLLVPPAFQSWRKLSFERMRWQESSR